MTGSFLQEPPLSPQVQALYDEDLADGGHVWNVSRLWAHQIPGGGKTLRRRKRAGHSVEMLLRV